jgi:hypothetical protein
MSANRRDFVDDVAHVPRREELALLYIDAALRARRGLDQIRLTAEERGDLQHIGDFGRRLAVRDFMDIRENRQTELAFDLCQDGKPAFQAGAAKAIACGAIGLVVAGLEDEREIEVVADFRQCLGGLHAPSSRSR